MIISSSLLQKAHPLRSVGSDSSRFFFSPVWKPFSVRISVFSFRISIVANLQFLWGKSLKITKVHVRSGNFFIRPQVIVRIPLDVGIEDAQRIDVCNQVTTGLRKWRRVFGWIVFLICLACYTICSDDLILKNAWQIKQFVLIINTMFCDNCCDLSCAKILKCAFH